MVFKYFVLSTSSNSYSKYKENDLSLDINQFELEIVIWGTICVICYISGNNLIELIFNDILKKYC